ncbi:hypothetical protein [Faecalibaculum rodentium]|uniref:hypothetical protein n=1 Tax=Faecalibaculum rodentium TaxID=1702221 RepID=UPI0023F3A70A|nr:hypothetical protein [Faecalibaculum rodentium]
MKLKVTILFKGEKDPGQLLCSQVIYTGDSLGLLMSDFLYRYAMNEIVNFKVEPLEEK